MSGPTALSLEKRLAALEAKFGSPEDQRVIQVVFVHRDGKRTMGPRVVIDGRGR